jgi:hypothetical protein
MSPKVALEKKRPLDAERPVGAEGVLHPRLLDDDAVVREVAREIRVSPAPSGETGRLSERPGLLI